jgi:hypothetical protein
MDHQSQIFADKINNIQTTFFSALDDFKKYYVYFNKNPEVNEFQNYYANSKGQLQTMSRDMLVTTNNIEKNIEDLNIQMETVSLKLEDEKKLNGELIKLISGLENTQNGSVMLIDDSKEEYNIQYFKNWQYIISIIILSFTIGIASRKSNT